MNGPAAELGVMAPQSHVEWQGWLLLSCPSQRGQGGGWRGRLSDRWTGDVTSGWGVWGTISFMILMIPDLTPSKPAAGGGTAKNCCLLDHLEGCWAEACFQHVPRKTDGKASGDALFQTPHCPESCKSMTWMMKRGATNRTRNNSKVTDRRVHFWRITPGSRTMQTYFPPNSLSFFVSNFLINFY